MRRDANACLPKWTVVPGRCPTHAQWHVHSIFSWWASYFCTKDFSFRHFREIGSNWKYQRTNRVPFDPSVHKTDHGIDGSFSARRLGKLEMNKATPTSEWMKSMNEAATIDHRQATEPVQHPQALLELAHGEARQSLLDRSRHSRSETA